MTRLLAAFVLMVGLAVPAWGQEPEHGTAEEAQAMVSQAIALFDEVGMGEALRLITKSPAPDFRDRDLYVFVIDTSGTIAAHALFPQSVGSNGINATDPRGNPYVQEMLARASPQGAWVDYLFANPLTGQMEPKSTWVVLHEHFIFACGIYAGEVGI